MLIVTRHSLWIQLWRHTFDSMMALFSSLLTKTDVASPTIATMAWTNTCTHIIGQQTMVSPCCRLVCFLTMCLPSFTTYWNFIPHPSKVNKSYEMNSCLPEDTFATFLTLVKNFFTTTCDFRLKLITACVFKP